jgi:hypothetical protein
MTQLVSLRTRRICSRSACSRSVPTEWQPRSTEWGWSKLMCTYSQARRRHCPNRHRLGQPQRYNPGFGTIQRQNSPRIVVLNLC